MAFEVKAKLRIAYGLTGSGRWAVYMVRLDEEGNWLGYEITVGFGDTEQEAERIARALQVVMSPILGHGNVELHKEVED